MRRVVLFAAFLLVLGLTTATAASFDVQAEDITSFTTEVSISVPTCTSGSPWYLVTKDGQRRLSTCSADLGSDVLEVPLSTLNPSAEWGSGALTGGLLLEGHNVTLQIYKNGGSGTLRATLHDCTPGTSTCEEIRRVEFVVPDNKLYTDLIMATTSFSTTANVAAGNELRLRIERIDGGTGEIKIQWGKSQPDKASQVMVG